MFTLFCVQYNVRSEYLTLDSIFFNEDIRRSQHSLVFTKAYMYVCADMYNIIGYCVATLLSKLLVLLSLFIKVAKCVKALIVVPLA